MLTDRVTFSAASNFATEIEQTTGALFVGEAMGGGLNFWDDVKFYPMPHLPVPMRIGVSTRYYAEELSRRSPADHRSGPRCARPVGRLLLGSRHCLGNCDGGGLGQSVDVGSGLQAEHLGIAAIQGQELLMGAVLHHPSLVEHVDAIGGPHRREPV